MGRFYSVTFPSLTVSAAQDFLQIKGAAGKVLRIHRVWWSDTDTTIPTSQMVSTRCRFLPATVTDGSTGGTPNTIGKIDPGDPAASFTFLCNNTTKATTGGTAIIQDEHSDHIYNGYDRRFTEAQPVVGPSESFVFELLSSVSGTVNMTGGAIVEEIGG